MAKTTVELPSLSFSNLDEGEAERQEKMNRPEPPPYATAGTASGILPNSPPASGSDNARVMENEMNDILEKLAAEIRDGATLIPAYDVQPILAWILRLKELDGCHCQPCTTKFAIVFDEGPEEPTP